MIAISSHKPFAKSDEYARNQTRAHATWIDKFDQIYYIGHYEEGLCSKQSQFVRPDGDYPTIKAMAELAHTLTPGYTAILNADIVLGDGIKDVAAKMDQMALPAATSYRYEFDPADPDPMATALRHKEDRGMDIFIATGAIWKMVAKEIPDNLWFGHNRWDSWVCGPMTWGAVWFRIKWNGWMG
jgi:hypothetical protein